ncbi:MAG: transcriptional regulator [Verrucomicrobia bacterium]|jgi:predicted Zn-ribbon and HTH transcriptional regulator|nr:transcriptional regulator [Verrucomicrobiota bacterium]
MFRKALIDLLLDNPMSVAEIAREHKMQIKEVATDLEHLRKSLRHSGHSLEVTPARCRKCGFEFGPEKLTKPSRCPKCRATWIREPRVQVRRG